MEIKEPFIIKQYCYTENPIIKGNGFDGLILGDDIEDAYDFINAVNKLLAENKRLWKFVNYLSKILKIKE